ncbi:hypothetical protein V1264_000955 [Littorina saxatilis]|uniref:Uncharacterized protein n=1 Tax=Littorina saxatilis TaxID=31220 RepID=A0AAN9C0E8_9CAEN
MECASDETSTLAEGESAIQDTAESAVEVIDTGCDNPPSDTSIAEENVDSPGLTPLVINTDYPSPPPPSSALDDTPPLTEGRADPDAVNSEDQAFPSASPGFDIPPSTANVRHNVVPLSLTQTSPPTSPDHPSTPSSLNSSSDLLDSSANKQRRGKKVGHDYFVWGGGG